ncbi:MAG TPA: hypothetical protein VHV58_08780 [Pseudolabrys sp.]|jgi:hypothetical protein|nr:hypothetical protein [Pseudolabrys sp.]
MHGKTKRRLRNGAAITVLLAFGMLMSGCGTSTLFTSSSKPTANDTATAANASAAPAPEVDCPDIQVRLGAATLMIGDKPGGGEPAALDLRYQGSIIRTARECAVHNGQMTMKVGIEGRIITGPAGGPGEVDVPMRIAVVQEGVNPKTIASKFSRVSVNVTGAVDRVTFTLIEPDITFPIPQRASDIDAYVVYVGFDAMSAAPKAKPAAKPKGKRKAKPAA